MWYSNTHTVKTLYIVCMCIHICVSAHAPIVSEDFLRLLGLGIKENVEFKLLM